MDAMVRATIVSLFAHVSKFELLMKKSGTSASCSDAFRTPDQTGVPGACLTGNVCAKLAVLKMLDI
jgi:hypothetical protein